MSLGEAISVDLSDVLRGLDLMRARGADLRAVFRDVKEWLKPEIAEHFDAAEGPEGPWAPRAASTIARARQNRGFTRRAGKRRGQMTKRGERWAGRQLGRFRAVNAYRISVTRQSLTMQAKGAWAGIHQYGGVANHGAKIPARPFLWVGEILLDRFANRIVEHVVEGWQS